MINFWRRWCQRRRPLSAEQGEAIIQLLYEIALNTYILRNRATAPHECQTLSVYESALFARIMEGHKRG